MRINDFLSNKLFDALACETFIISDKIPSADILFEESVVTYNSIEDLNQNLEFYLKNDEECIKKAKNGKKIVLKNHTFDNMVDTIIDCINNSYNIILSNIRKEK